MEDKENINFEKLKEYLTDNKEKIDFGKLTQYLKNEIIKITKELEEYDRK